MDERDEIGGLGTIWEVARAVAPLGWTAFGGPQAHIGLIQQELVVRRGWTDSRGFAELLGLCSILPGPTSTQLITALGAVRGGILGAISAVVVWMFPAATIATLAGIGLTNTSSSLSAWLVGARIAAVALVVLAAWRLGRRLVTGPLTGTLCAAGCGITLLSTAPAVFPLLLGGSAALGALLGHKPTEPVGDTAAVESARPVWSISRRVSLAALAAYLGLLVALPIAQSVTGWRPLIWVNACYRAGALVFGGGQVMISILLGDVTGPGGLSHARFLDGLGLVQALPGPLSSFSGYVGGALGGVGMAVLCLAAMFLPGLLLVVGFLHWWDAARRYPRVRAGLGGANACAVGLIVTAAVLLARTTPHGPGSILLFAAALVAAGPVRLPAPLVILGALVLGYPLITWLG